MISIGKLDTADQSFQLVCAKHLGTLYQAHWDKMHLSWLISWLCNHMVDLECTERGSFADYNAIPLKKREDKKVREFRHYTNWIPGCWASTGFRSTSVRPVR